MPNLNSSNITSILAKLKWPFLFMLGLIGFIAWMVNEPLDNIDGPVSTGMSGYDTTMNAIIKNPFWGIVGCISLLLLMYSILRFIHYFENQEQLTLKKAFKLFLVIPGILILLILISALLK